MMTTETNYLVHHGIKGQKWGVRRFQNLDGSRTSAGLAHDRALYAEKTGKSSNNVSDSAETSRKGLTDSQKQALKTVGKAALIAGSVAAAGYLYARNKDAVDAAFSTMAKNIVGNKLPTEITSSGRSFVQKAFDDAQMSSLKRADRREAINRVTKKAISGVQTVTEGAGNAAKAVGKTAKDAANRTGEVAKDIAAKTGDAIKTSAQNSARQAKSSISKASKRAGATVSKAAEDASEKATAYMITRTAEKAAERRLQAKQEKNRHKEEMARIRRGA